MGDTTPRDRALNALHAQRVLGIVRAATPDQARDAAESLLAAGLHTVEISLSVPGALAVIHDLATRGPEYVAIGAGTVLNPGDAEAALDAGAHFLVSPVARTDIIAMSHRRDAAVIPGAATPTEMALAADCGADMVKLFPASAYPPHLLVDILQALPHLRLVPTGGVTTQSAAKWIAAGAAAVALGGALTQEAGPPLPARIEALLDEVATEAKAQAHQPGQ